MVIQWSLVVIYSLNFESILLNDAKQMTINDF